MTAPQLPRSGPVGPVLRDDLPPPDVLAPDGVAVRAESALADWEAHRPESGTPTWHPTDMAQAEWCLGMVRHLAAEQTAIRAQAALWRQQIDDWEQRATAAPGRRQAFLEAALGAYTAERVAADPKVRTVHLPSGRLTATVPKTATVIVTDEAALLDWLYQAEHTADGANPTEAAALAHDAIKRTPDTVLLPPLRKLVRAEPDGQGGWVAVCPYTGEVPPGVGVVAPGPPSYAAKPTT